MDVCIDEARKHDVRSKVELAHTCRPLVVLADRSDSSVAHNNRRRAKTLRQTTRSLRIRKDTDWVLSG